MRRISLTARCAGIERGRHVARAECQQAGRVEERRARDVVGRGQRFDLAIQGFELAGRDRMVRIAADQVADDELVARERGILGGGAGGDDGLEQPQAARELAVLHGEKGLEHLHARELADARQRQEVEQRAHPHRSAEQHELPAAGALDRAARRAARRRRARRGAPPRADRRRARTTTEARACSARRSSPLARWRARR